MAVREYDYSTPLKAAESTIANLTERSMRLEMELAALKAHHGWHVITPETKWEKGTQFGYWFNGRFHWADWPTGWLAEDCISHGSRGGAFYRRLNAPPQCEARV